MTILEIYLTGGVLLLGSFSLLWLLSLRIKDASIVDIAWGLSFVVCAWVYFGLAQDGYFPRKMLVVSLVSIWGLRLATHIFLRNRGKDEDFRYANWRGKYGNAWRWRSYLQVFVLQGFLAWLISFPLLAAQFANLPDRLTTWDWSGAIVWLVGFTFEALGDYQLARFKRKPHPSGEILRSGLWKYTRHPNYFGEAVLWWGYGLIAVSVPNGWISLASPMMMSYLLTRVSGVRMLDKALRERKPAYQEYMQTTSAFFPWFPKRAAQQQNPINEQKNPGDVQETSHETSLYN